MAPGVLYGIGAQKAGTSWLFQTLRKHPRIAFPLRKEAHYWDWVEQKKRPRMDEKYWADLEGETADWVGDFTPDYSAIAPGLIRELFSQRPQTRVLIVLRNPVDRAWSAARMLAGQAHFTAEEVDDAWLARVCRSQASFLRGDYATILENWLSVFPRDQVKVLGFSDVVNEPRITIAGVLGWLGLDIEWAEGQAMPRAANVAMPRKMPADLKAELAALYAPSLKRLDNVLQRYAIALNTVEWSSLHHE